MRVSARKNLVERVRDLVDEAPIVTVRPRVSLDYTGIAEEILMAWCSKGDNSDKFSF